MASHGVLFFPFGLSLSSMRLLAIERPVRVFVSFLVRELWWALQHQSLRRALHYW